MKITSKDSVKDIMLRNSALFSLANEQIIEKVKMRPVPKRLRVGVFRRVKARGILASVTMEELSKIQDFQGSYVEYFCKMMTSTQKRRRKYVTNGEVLKMRFIPAMRLFIHLCSQLEMMVEMIKELELPLSPKEVAASVKIPPKGIHDLVSSFCRRCPSYTHEQAYALPWSVVYRELLIMWQENMTQRNYQRMVENEMKTKAR